MSWLRAPVTSAPSGSANASARCQRAPSTGPQAAHRGAARSAAACGGRWRRLWLQAGSVRSQPALPLCRTPCRTPGLSAPEPRSHCHNCSLPAAYIPPGNRAERGSHAPQPGRARPGGRGAGRLWPDQQPRSQGRRKLGQHRGAGAGRGSNAQRKAGHAQGVPGAGVGRGSRGCLVRAATGARRLRRSQSPVATSRRRAGAAELSAASRRCPHRGCRLLHAVAPAAAAAARDRRRGGITSTTRALRRRQQRSSRGSTARGAAAEACGAAAEAALPSPHRIMIIKDLPLGPRHAGCQAQVCLLQGRHQQVRQGAGGGREYRA